MSNLATFGRRKGSRDKKKRLIRAIKRGLFWGSIGGTTSAVLQEGLKVGYKKYRNKPLSSNLKYKIPLNIVGGALLGAIGEGVGQGVIQQLKNNNNVNYSVSSLANFANEPKQKVKVKSFLRKGKTVRSYTRNNKKRKKQITVAASVGTVASAGLLIALSRERRIRLALDVLSRNTKNQFRNLKNIVPKRLEQVTNEAKKVSLAKNAKSIKNTTNTVFFVDNLKDGKTYVFKQSKIIPGFKLTNKAGFGTYTHGNEQASEALASELGKKYGINIQSTEIIPANHNFEGKLPGLPGSIHSVVPGKPVSDVFKDRTFSVQHLAYKTNSKQIADDLFMQKDIAEISALDTFLGNEDRNPNNLFYDAVTKKFTAIDNGRIGTFPYNYKKLRKAIDSNYSRMSDAQKSNLRAYHKKLKELLAENSPASLSQKYDDYFVQSLSGADKKVYEEALKSRKKRIKNIFYSYEQSKGIADYLDILLGK